MGFLSNDAMTSKSNNRRPYTLAEDMIICQGLEDGDSAAVIVESLAAEDHTRTVLSVRYRITTLRDAANKFESLEEFHQSKGHKVAKPVTVVEAPVEPEVEPEGEPEGDEATELEDLVAEA